MTITNQIRCLETLLECVEDLRKLNEENVDNEIIFGELMLKHLKKQL